MWVEKKNSVPYNNIHPNFFNRLAFKTTKMKIPPSYRIYSHIEVTIKTHIRVNLINCKFDQLN